MRRCRSAKSRENVSDHAIKVKNLKLNLTQLLSSLFFSLKICYFFLSFQLLRSSLVNHRIQAAIARELGLDKLINFGNQVFIRPNSVSLFH